MAKILVVDDEENIRSVFKRALEADGYEVFVAPDISSGYKIAISEEPDLGIFDTSVGKEDGLGLAKRINQELDIPVIGMSGQDMRQEWEEQGFAYLPKPFNLNHLREVVAETLEKSVD